MSVGFSIGMISGRSSMQVRAAEMAVIANNIAKVNQESYHRQTISLANNTPVLASEAYYGTGVHISAVVREYDIALENSLRLATSQKGYDNIYSQILSQLEDLVLPGGENFLDGAIQAFANSLQDVATTPESLTARNSLIGNAGIVANMFNQEQDHLTELGDYLAENDATGSGAILERINELNALAHQVASLNDRIMLLEQSAFNSQKANDARDQRDELIMRMADIADVKFTETPDYRYKVTLGGATLVHVPKSGDSMVNEINFTMIREQNSDASSPSPAFDRIQVAGRWAGMDLSGRILHITDRLGNVQERTIESNTDDALIFERVPMAPSDRGSDGTVAGDVLTANTNRWAGMTLDDMTVKVTNTTTGNVEYLQITNNTNNSITLSGAPVDGNGDYTYEIYETGLPPGNDHLSYTIYDPTLTWSFGSTNNVTIGNGSLKALMSARDYVIEKAADLDYFARDFADVINITHRTGGYPDGGQEIYDLDGRRVVDSDEYNFFRVADDGRVSVLINNGRRVGASTVRTETGNGQNMINMWTTMDTPFHRDTGGTPPVPVRALDYDSLMNFTDRYNRTLAIEVRNSLQQLSASDSSVAMFKNAIFNRSGVNMDEEMTRMLEVQRAFQAAAKYISTLDGMMGVVMNMI